MRKCLQKYLLQVLLEKSIKRDKNTRSVLPEKRKDKKHCFQPGYVLTLACDIKEVSLNEPVLL